MQTTEPQTGWRIGRLTAGLAVIACIGVPGAVQAQMRAHSWEVSPSFAVMNTSDALGGDTETAPGLRFGYSFDRWWQLEAGYFSASDLAAQQQVGTQLVPGQDEFGVSIALIEPVNGPADSDMDMFELNVVLSANAKKRRWVPYATLGWGYSDFSGAMTQEQVDQSFPDGANPGPFDLNGDGFIDPSEAMVDEFDCPSCIPDPNNPDFHFLADGDLESFDSTQWSFGGGVRVHLTDSMALRLDLRNHNGVSENYNIQMLTAAMSFRLGGEAPLDDDMDTIPSYRDLCPETPVGATVDHKGCPADTDGDAILDGLDQCPGTPAGWPVQPDGCPTDTDGDGVPDGRDSCPDTVAGAVVDFEGCAVDSDGDQVPDGIDQCSLTPAGAVVDEVGCPLDSDQDGVFDGLDQCDATEAGLPVDEFGCPIDSDGDGLKDDVDACRDFAGPGGVDEEGCPRLRLDKSARVPVPNITFASGSSVLTDAAQDDLLALLASLEYYPDLVIEVEGHTDDIGSERENFLISVERAAAIRRWLVDAGINADRIRTRGYGETRPIDDNQTPEGRAINRRIEVLVLGPMESVLSDN